jgi:predicted permease
MGGIILIKVVPVFIIIALGYLAGRVWKITPDMIRVLTNITIFFFLPSLIFVSSLNTQFDSSATMMIVAAMFVVLTVGLISFFLAKRLRLENGTQNGFMLGTMFMNAGSMGSSVALFAFGTEAFLLAIVFYLTVQMLLYTVGVFIVSNGGVNLKSLKPVLALPLVWALLLGLGFQNVGVATDIDWAPIQMMAGAAIPLLLVTLGMQLSLIKPKADALRLPAMTAAVRIPLGLVLALAFVLVLGLQGIEKSVVLLSASMPTAITTFVIGSKFDADKDQLSQQILLTTVISIFSVPIILLAIVSL